MAFFGFASFMDVLYHFVKACLCGPVKNLNTEPVAAVFTLGRACRKDGGPFYQGR
jgi:hypothetical protein